MPGHIEHGVGAGARQQQARPPRSRQVPPRRPLRHQVPRQEARRHRGRGRPRNGTGRAAPQARQDPQRHGRLLLRGYF